jgi:hypothetical protein
MSNNPIQDDFADWLQKLTESCIRVDRLAGRYSLLDVIKYQKKTSYPSNELQRILQKNPELEEKIVYQQFEGRRQNETPTIAIADLPFLYQIFYDKLRLPRRPTSKPKPPLLARVAVQQERGENAAPYGWRWDAADQLMRPIHAEQQAIRYLRQLRAFGTRYTEIAAQLERDQIFTRSRLPWTASQVEEVIRFDHEALMQTHEEFSRRVRALFHAG